MNMDFGRFEFCYVNEFAPIHIEVLLYCEVNVWAESTKTETEKIPRA